MNNLSENSLTVLEKRYFLKDENGKIIEDWEGLCHRVAKAVAKDEKTKELRKEWGDKYFDLMYNRFFLPNTPTLLNAGKRDGQYAACFVLDVEDNMESIMDTAKHMALIHKSGGGTGFNFSKLRSNNSRVKTTNGIASGPISFMTMYNDITEQIKQGGARKGANMGLLNVSHPDILDFISCKQDTSKITNFNISVAITDKFMNILLKNEEYNLIDPSTEKSVKKVKARDVFDKICKQAWLTGEPGVFFIDTVNKKNKYGKIIACNPCVTGDTLVATLNGNVPIKTLAEQSKDVIVYCWNPKTRLPELQWMRNIRKTREKVEVWGIEFDSGLKLKATPDHSLFSFRGKKIKVKDLKVGQRVRAFSSSSDPNNHIRMHGSKHGKTQHIWVHRSLWELHNGKVPKDYIVHHINRVCDDNRIENLEIMTEYEHNSHHYVDRVKNGFHSIGVNKSRECGKKISNSLKKYFKKKKEFEDETILNHKVINVKPYGYEEVYNGTVDNCETYIVADEKYCGFYLDGIISGIVSANCSEQPLRTNEACTLGSVNLTKFIVNGKFDWKTYVEYIKVATRFLDSVVSVNTYPLSIIADTHKETRKIGIGVMGFADSLILLGYKYGDKDSYEYAREIYKTLQCKASEYSEDLGAEKGLCKATKELGMKQRNLYVTTIAPTGSISIIAECSHGIEPMYGVGYIRTCLDNTKMFVLNPIFVDVMKEYGTSITNELKDKIASSNSIQDIKEIPKEIRELFITAYDLSYEQHVKMQAVFQEHSDSAISKTINFPKSATVKDIEKAYLLAYKMGCKGVSVYRDGSRPNQVLSIKKEDHTRKSKYRTSKLSGTTEKIKTPLGSLLLTINTDSEGNPIEVLLAIGKSGKDILSFCEAVGRIVSSSLQHGIPMCKIYKQLKGIGGKRNSLLTTKDMPLF